MGKIARIEKLYRQRKSQFKGQMQDDTLSSREKDVISREYTEYLQYLKNLANNIGHGEGYIAHFESGNYLYILGEEYEDALYLATYNPYGEKFLRLEKIIPMKIFTSKVEI